MSLYVLSRKARVRDLWYLLSTGYSPTRSPKTSSKHDVEQAHRMVEEELKTQFITKIMWKFLIATNILFDR